MKWCNESARDSIAACAIDALKSIRTKCKVSKPSRIKVSVQPDNSLMASFRMEGKKKTPVIRLLDGRTRYTPRQNERIRYVDNGTKFSQLHVYRYMDGQEGREITYLIAAPSAAVAKAEAKRIAIRRAMRYSGLAKRALGFLMQKTNTRRVNDPFNPVVENKADDVTDKHERV